MAHFYGTVQGARGEASRLGHPNTGLETMAASWEGCVRVRLEHDSATDTDTALVYLDRHKGSGTHRVLYDGPVGAYVPKHAAQVAAARKALADVAGAPENAPAERDSLLNALAALLDAVAG